MAKDFHEGLADALNSAKDIGEKATKAAIKKSICKSKSRTVEKHLCGCWCWSRHWLCIGGSIGVVGFFGGIGILAVLPCCPVAFLAIDGMQLQR